jgi:hypothetical protein
VLSARGCEDEQTFLPPRALVIDLQRLQLLFLFLDRILEAEEDGAIFPYLLKTRRDESGIEGGREVFTWSLASQTRLVGKRRSGTPSSCNKWTSFFIYEEDSSG